MNDLLIFDDFESFLVTVGTSGSKLSFTIVCNKILFKKDFVEFSYSDKTISCICSSDVLSIRKILYTGSEDFILIYSKE